MSDSPAATAVQLCLTRNEAIVLFELLSRYADGSALAIADQAEQRVLWDLCSMLERELHEPISPDYDELLARAREAVRDRAD